MKHLIRTNTSYLSLLILTLIIIAPFWSPTPKLSSELIPPLDNMGRMEDSLELVRLYNNLSGPIWNEDWDFSEPIDTWYGIELNEEGRVIVISLSNNRLFGPLPADLDLPFLRDLYLADNQINGSLPDFTHLPNLFNLHLQFNQLTGTIPDFTQISNLEYFLATGNQLEGPVPDFTNVPRLKWLELHGNLLTGEIPDLQNLPFLEFLDLRLNKFKGNIPDFSGLPNLTSLQLGGDSLSGGIPDFSQLPDLVFLKIESAPVSGTIPDFSNLPKLEELFLFHTEVGGPIPDFTKLPDLTSLWLAQNRLEGTIPDFSNLPKLKTCNLSNNRLYGDLPDFSNLPNLIDLQIVTNQLIGPIPDFSNLEDLEMLYLGENLLNSKLPDFSNLPRLSEIDLHQNNLDDSIPNFSNLPRLEKLKLGSNRFTYCPRFTHLPLLESLYIDINGLTFEDVLRNMDWIRDYQYGQQQQIKDACSYILTSIGSDLTIQLYFDQGVKNNVYSWLKFGQPYLTVTGQNYLNINNIQWDDEADYECVITNPDVPGLELRTEPFSVRLGGEFSHEPNLLTVEPAQPSPDEGVTLYYDITSGNAALADCNCDIYIHTGAFTRQARGFGFWDYVATNPWGVPNPDWKLTPSPGQPNLYSFQISPSIREFYGIPAEEEIEKLAMVFRNGPGTIVGNTEFNENIIYPITPPPIASSPLELRIENASGGLDELVCLDVMAQSSTPVSGMEYTIEWDPGMLEFNGIANRSLTDLEISDFDLSHVQAGKLFLDWQSESNPEGVIFPAPSPLYQLCFTVKVDSCQNSTIFFSDALLPPYAAGVGGGCLYLESLPGLFTATCQEALHLPEVGKYEADAEYTDESGWTNYLKMVGNGTAPDTILLGVNHKDQGIGSVGDGVLSVQVRKEKGTTDVTEIIQQIAGFEQIEQAQLMHYFWELTPNYTAVNPAGPFGLRFFFSRQDLVNLGTALGTGVEIAPSNLIFFKAAGALPEDGKPDLSDLASGNLRLFKPGEAATTATWKETGFGEEDFSGSMLVEDFSFGGVIAYTGIVNRVDEIPGLEQLVLMPNPARDQVLLSFSVQTSEMLTLRIINSFGQNLREEKMRIPSGEHKRLVPLEDFSPGVYFLQLQNQRGQLTSRKFIIAK